VITDYYVSEPKRRLLLLGAVDAARDLTGRIAVKAFVRKGRQSDKCEEMGDRPWGYLLRLDHCSCNLDLDGLLVWDSLQLLGFLRCTVGGFCLE
jgi:hypothetical protein